MMVDQLPCLGDFYGVGVGPGDPSLLTLKAAECLRKSDRIFYVEGRNSKESISRSVVLSLGEGIESKLEGLLFSMAPEMEKRRASWRRNADHIVSALNSGETCAFATIGDPLIYSTFVYILPYIEEDIPGLKTEIIPGITSFQAAAAKCGIPLVMDDEILALVPAWKEEYMDRVNGMGPDTVVCLKTYRTRNAVAGKLRDHHTGEFLYASRVGHRDEKLIIDPRELEGLPEEYLSLIISRKTPYNAADS
jgi:precorrin-2/cobalt-factor-2 C20-methyltransferase